MRPDLEQNNAVDITPYQYLKTITVINKQGLILITPVYQIPRKWTVDWFARKKIHLIFLWKGGRFAHLSCRLISFSTLLLHPYKRWSMKIHEKGKSIRCILSFDTLETHHVVAEYNTSSWEFCNTFWFLTSERRFIRDSTTIEDRVFI